RRARLTPTRSMTHTSRMVAGTAEPARFAIGWAEFVGWVESSRPAASFSCWRRELVESVDLEDSTHPTVRSRFTTGEAVVRIFAPFKSRCETPLECNSRTRRAV